MAKEKFKVNSDDMLRLVAAVYIDYKLKGKLLKEESFPYIQLLSQVETYRLTNTKFDPSIHKIDDFMVDAYQIYEQYQSVEDILDENLHLIVQSLGNFSQMPGLGEEDIKREFKTITTTFEALMINCEFEGVQIRGIQNNFLKDVMKEAIEDENYELCAKLKKKLDTF